LIKIHGSKKSLILVNVEQKNIKKLPKSKSEEDKSDKKKNLRAKKTKGKKIKAEKEKRLALKQALEPGTNCSFCFEIILYDVKLKLKFF